MRLEVLCPAKLNLFLSVGPRDERGWHPLRSTFVAVNLFDRLLVSFASEDSFSSDAEYLLPKNTVTKALQILRQHYEFPALRIELGKIIPAQSGLGGGSSDAAGLIRAVQTLVSDLDHPKALAIAAQVGADVPFFLVGGRAHAEGYGEILTPLPDGPIQNFVIVKPEVDCPTPAMFEALDQLDYPWKELPAETILYNDFERVMPEVCLHWTNQLRSFGATQAGLTGSGSAVFGLFDSSDAAAFTASQIEDSGGAEVWVCRSLTRRESLAVMTNPVNRSGKGSEAARRKYQSR